MNGIHFYSPKCFNLDINYMESSPSPPPPAPHLLNTYWMLRVINSNKKIKKFLKTCTLPSKKMSNLIIEARIIHLRQHESNKLFPSLRLMSSKANTLQGTKQQGERVECTRMCGKQMGKLVLRTQTESLRP